MKSNFAKDVDTEAEVSKFVDKYMYPQIGNSFERLTSMEKQHKGIDVILKIENESLFIDDKSAIYYANKNLKTFAFELSYFNRQEELREGWLLDTKLETSHYNLMWLNTKQKDIKPWNIKCEDILNIESMIISKNALFNYLNEFGYNQENLRKKAKEFRNSNQSRLKLTPHIELIFSPHLEEKSINLKIDKEELKKIAAHHVKVNEFEILNLRPNKPIKQVNNSKDFLVYGEKAEAKVYEAIDEYFKGREAKVFTHYPVHNIGNQGRYEIDILTVGKSSGISIIEVKGITIDQITSIQGGKWYMNNYFDQSYINPYRQAEKQLNALSEDIESDSRLKREFTKRVIIALPYISKDDWKKSGYDQITNMPPIIFKDDLENISNLSKVENAYLFKAHKPISEKSWKLLKEYFSIEDNSENLINTVYSSLYILPSETAFNNKKQEIEDKLFNGIKVTLLCYFVFENTNWKEELKAFIKHRQLEYFHSKQNTNMKDITVINDGENYREKLPSDIIKDFPTFNYKQYEVIHVLQEDNQLVTAGAGTGKTHVMVDRIMYLLAKGVRLKDIIMITFTNESTNEMKRRLQNKLTDLSELTGKVRFSEYAEDVNSMQISTIHSYSKTILKTLAHELGYGTNLKQRSYKYEKQNIINELINEYYQLHPDARQINFIPHYKLTKIINEIWEELERKGFSEEDMRARLDWGTTSNKSEEIIQDLFEFVFTHCENRLNQMKQKDNAVSMNDLTRKIKELSSNAEKMQQLPSGKYLFMDEFQDSDNVQIELVASLANHLDYKLFIVGDVKQSIYRFRGADYKSFELIKKEVVNEEMKPDFKQFNLNLNYRSARTVLEKLDVIFSKWQEKNWLTSEDNEKLVGMYDRPEKVNEFQFIRAKKSDSKKAIIDSINQSIKMISKPEVEKEKNHKIALIVRTNKQAKEMEKLCNENNISTSQNLDGTFFTSNAVKDFKDLLDGLLFPNKATYLVNALQSPYFRYDIPYQLLMQFEGSNEKIIQFINKKIGRDFKRYVEDLRTLPILAIIQKIISEKSFFHHLKTYYKNEIEDFQLDTFLLQYKKNLFHLMNMMEQQFETMNMTLYKLHEWLTLQMRTNRTENEPMIEGDGHAVEITTVHRAKGLQYHTVIIPKTNHSFEAKKSIVHIEDLLEESLDSLNKRKIGWKFKYNNKSNPLKNSYYIDLDQININEVYKEEARLLYVAMTRVIDRLVVILPNEPSDKTWSELIEATKVEVSNYDS